MNDSPRTTRPQDRWEYSDELRWTFSHRRGWLVGFAVNVAIADVFVGYTHL